MLTDNPNEPLPEEQSAKSIEPATPDPETPKPATPANAAAEVVAAPAAEQVAGALPSPQAPAPSPEVQREEEPTSEAKALKAKELEDKLLFGKVQEALSAEGAKDKKEDAERRPTHFPVTSQRRQQIEKLFVAPPDYFIQQQPLLEQGRVGVVYGPEYADLTMCAEHLGLLLTGQIVSPRASGESTDQYTELEEQVEELLRRIDTDPRYSLASNLASTLDENLRSARLHRDTSDLQNARSQLTLQLNRIALSTLGLSLKQMRHQPAKATASVRNLWILDWSREAQQPLTESVKRLNENDVYVVRKPVEVDTEFGEQIEAVTSHLSKCRTILIFIQQRAESELFVKGACQIVAYPPLDTDTEREFAQQAFRKYFTYYGAVIPAATQDLLDDLITIYLKGRFPIAVFFDELRSLEDEASEDEIRAVAEGMGNLDPKYARNRFREWSYNHRLYAMLITLFTDVTRPILDKIYIAAVSELRNGGVATLCDPREIGMDDMLHTIRAREMDDHRLYFQYALIATEVDRQLDNHHHLLWSLLKIILGWVDQYRAPEYWQLRKALGAALGRMGLHRMEELREILDQLAAHSSGGVVAVAGYALDRICRVAPDKHDMVIQILRVWVVSGDPDQMWAAGAAIWRIYDGLIEIAQSDDLHNAQRGFATLDEVSKILTTLVQTFKYFSGKAHYQLWQKAGEEKLSGLAAIEFVLSHLTAWAAANLDAILHAVRQIAWKHPARMVSQIRTWLQAEDENQQQIGLLAGYQLFETNSRPDMPLSAQQQLPLLGLIQPLLTAPEEFEEKQHTVDIVLQALLHWFTHTDWSEQIQAHLLYLLNRSTADVATLLCDSIARHWLESGQPAVQQAGRALMLRAYAIHGIPLDMPGQHAGLILLDAADSARANQEGTRTGAAFYRRFAPRLDLYLRRMGDRQMQIAPGQAVVPTDLQLYYALPALIMPPLQAAALTRLAFILILTWDKVIDADDLAETDANKLVAALFGDQATENETLWPEQVKVIAVQSDGAEREAIDQAVNALLARTLANQSTAEWWSGLQSYFAAESATQVAHQLQEWIPRLDQFEHCRYPDDLMRIVVCSAGWLAKTDLTLCVETLQRWLEHDDPNQRIVGAACGKFLFTLFMAAEPPVDPYAQLMRLAPLLGKQSWDAAQIILQAAYRWSTQPDWKKRLLVQPSGEAGELVAMIDQTATTYEKQMTRLFDTWATDEPATDKPATKPQTADFAEQLRLRLALSSRQPLPGLLADGIYCLILVDTAVHNLKKRRWLANMAAKVIEQLTDKLKQQAQPNVHLLVYRLGRDHLVAGPGEKPDENVLLPTANTRYPRLIGPLLERFSPQQIGFVLSFTDALPTDGEDWRLPELQRRILFYADDPDPDWAGMFTVLPKEDKLDNTVAMITNHLMKLIGV